MPLTPSEIGHLVSAMLAVNNYGVARATGLVPAFAQRGLLDPARVAAMDRDALVAAMNDAGYARGGFLPILWYRHQQLMDAIARGVLDELPAFVKANNEHAFKATLSGVHGWGPVTSATAWVVWCGVR